MAAEIYHFNPGDNGVSPIRGQLLQEDQTYWDTGYCDSSGLERLVTVCYGRVEILSGRVELEEQADGSQGVSITGTKHVESLEPGETRVEELTGPEDEIRLLHVRNIDERTVFPRGAYFFRHPSGLDAGVSVTFN